MLPLTAGGPAQEVDRARLRYKAAPLPLLAGPTPQTGHGSSAQSLSTTTSDKPQCQPARHSEENGYCVMAYRSEEATKQQQDWLRQQRFKPKAREILRSWARAWEYWNRAIRYLKLARFAPDPDVRNRFIVIARHYRALAQAEEHSAGREGINGTIST